MPKVSIIMPSLNVAPYIEECITSVMNQTLQDIEIICVDAGSTDGTFEILKKAAGKDSRIQLLHSDYKSYGHQMNMGLRAARADYVGIVETDDIVRPDMFEKLYALTVNTNVDYAKSNYSGFYENNGEKKYVDNVNGAARGNAKRIIQLEEEPRFRIAHVDNIWSAIYKREFLIKNELWFLESPGASFQDTSFSTLVGAVAKTCIYTEECLYEYRKDRPESSVKSNEKIFCIKDEFAYVDQYIREHDITDPIILKGITQRKIGGYTWNAKRLSMDAGKEFIHGIREEVEDLLRIPELHQIEKENAMLLLDYDKLAAQMRDENEKNRCFFETLKRGKNFEGYVAVGAGRFFDRLMDIQKQEHCCYVKAVCDNDRKLQGEEKSGYIVMSVENAVQKYQNEHWLILNKYHSSDILNQLQQLGIKREDVEIIDYMPEWEGIVRYFLGADACERQLDENEESCR